MLVGHHHVAAPLVSSRVQPSRRTRRRVVTSSSSGDLRDVDLAAGALVARRRPSSELRREVDDELAGRQVVAGGELDLAVLDDVEQEPQGAQRLASGPPAGTGEMSWLRIGSMSWAQGAAPLEVGPGGDASAGARRRGACRRRARAGPPSGGCGRPHPSAIADRRPTVGMSPVAAAISSGGGGPEGVVLNPTHDDAPPQIGQVGGLDPRSRHRIAERPVAVADVGVPCDDDLAGVYALAMAAYRANPTASRNRRSPARSRAGPPSRPST